MSERFELIEAILARISERLDRTAAQQEQNTRDIDALVEGISNVDLATERNQQRSRENAQRFENLLAEARADRIRAQAASDAWDQRFENMLADNRADRARADAEYAEWRSHSSAQLEVVQTLLLELRQSNRRIDSLEQAS